MCLGPRPETCVAGRQTFNAILKTERVTMTADGDWTYVILKTMAVSLIWPFYWLVTLFT